MRLSDVPFAVFISPLRTIALPDQFAVEMQDRAVAADPVLMPFAIGGIIIIDAHTAHAICRFPLFANRAAFGGAADFARADLVAGLRICDAPFA